MKQKAMKASREEGN